jgi:hypothetical protein
MKFTKTILKKALLAVNDLERKYRDKPMITRYKGRVNGGISDSCPLCKFNTLEFDGDCNTLDNPNSSSKDHCPWFWFEGHSCVAGDYCDQTIPQRLYRIGQWKVKIIKLLSRPKAQPPEGSDL